MTAKYIFEVILKKPKYEVSVVIPVYKSEMNDNERIAFSRCLTVLSKHPIYIVAPYNLDLLSYTQLSPNIKIIRFPAFYFDGIEGYNQLMLSSLFYSTFLAYKYILIYQLDCYVFKDELIHWCNQNYDYIGAPWPKNEWPYVETVYAWLPTSIGWLYKKKIKKMNFVGNGGFSLRKTKKFYFLSILLHRYIMHWNCKKAQEDIFWSFFAAVLYPFYKVSPEKVASRFSLEKGAQNLFQLNDHTLPFGGHAWEKYDKNFWLSEFSKLE